MTDIFITIFDSISQSMGYQWIATLVLFIAIFAILTVLLQLDVLLSFMVTSLPVLLFSMYNLISLGAYGVAIIVLLFGLMLGLSLYKLLFK